MLLRLPSQLGRLSVIVPSVVGGSGGFVAGTQQYRIILDASAHRHEAYKIYLRVAAAKRWEINRVNLARDLHPHSHFVASRQSLAAVQ
jgi:hypothetical protein